MRALIVSGSIFLLSLIAGCSSLWEEVRYIPIESDEWQVGDGSKTSKEEIDKNKMSASHSCNGIEFLVHELSIVNNAFWGPPLFPFIPNFENRKPFLSIDISGMNQQSLCPTVAVNEVDVQGKKRWVGAPWQRSTITCDYPILPSGSFSLKIAGVGGVAVCQVKPLKLQRVANWRYRPFVMPRT